MFRAFIEPLGVVGFDRAAAEVHGRLRQQLRHKPIGERDLLIAAIAVAGNHVVVTHHVEEFIRVSGLAGKIGLGRDASLLAGHSGESYLLLRWGLQSSVARAKRGC